MLAFSLGLSMAQPQSACAWNKKINHPINLFFGCCLQAARAVELVLKYEARKLLLKAMIFVKLELKVLFFLKKNTLGLPLHWCLRYAPEKCGRKFDILENFFNFNTANLFFQILPWFGTPHYFLLWQANRGFARLRLCTNEDGNTNNLVLYKVWNDTSKKGGGAPRAMD